MRWRSVILCLVAVAAATAGFAAWWVERAGRTFVTNGATIREPAGSAATRDILWTPPERLALNTGDDEYEPSVSADGRSLYFVRGRAGLNADLFVCRRSAEGWSQAEPLASINTDSDELSPCLSPDGKTLYFSSNREGGLGGYDLWMTELIGERWGPARNLAAVNSAEDEYSPAVSADGGCVWYASNRGRGGADSPASWDATIRETIARTDFDLYAASIGPDGPEAPSPVDALNTDANEGTPAFSPAGDFVYFASDRTGGPGGFDLFRSRLSAAGPARAERLAAHINSAANDLDPSLGMGGFAMVFSSDREALSRGSESGTDRRDYDIMSSVSREVYRVTESASAARWAAVWDRVAPWLLWFLLSLATVLLMMLLWKAQRNRHLSLLTRCLIGSVLVHLMILFLLSLWGVTTSLGTLFEKPGGTRVRLASAGAGDALAMQVRGGSPALTEVKAAPAVREAAVSLVPMEEAETAGPGRSQVATEAMQQSGSVPMAAAPKALPGRTDPVMSAREEVAVALPSAAAGSAREEATGVPTPTLPPTADPSPNAAMLAEGSSRSLPRSVPKVAPGVSREGAPIEAAILDERRRLIPATIGIAAQTDVALPESRIAASGDEPRPSAGVAMPEAPASPNLSLQGTLAMSGADGPTAARAAPKPGGTLAPVVDAPPARVSDRPAAATLSLGPASNDLALPTDAIRHADAVPERDESGGFGPTFDPLDAPLMIGLGVEGIEDNALLDAPAPGRSAVANGVTLAGDAPPLSLGPAAERPAVVTALDGATSVPMDLALPTEVAPPMDAFAQRDPERRLELVERLGGSKETEEAVARSLAWLASHQSDDGRWSSGHFDDGCRQCRGGTRIDSDRAVTGLALLCFLAADHTQSREGPYREKVSLALDWLVARQGSDGDLRGDETMYSHGIATIALAEAYAMTRDPRLARPVERAVAFIDRSRNTDAGGWRYEPREAGDTSVLGWQAMALMSARRAGIAVSEGSVRAADEWLDSVSVRTPGLYAYQPGMAPTHSMTAEGLYVRQILGRGRDEVIMRASVERIMQDRPRWKDRPNTYAWYYATLALFQHGGEEWEAWNADLTRELLSNQRTAGAAAGSWDPVDRWATIGGRVYQTAICTLTLEVYYRYLPMYGAQERAGERGPAPSP